MSATYNVRMAVYLQVSDQRHEIRDVRLEDREKRFSAFDPAALSKSEARNDHRMPVLDLHRINGHNAKINLQLQASGQQGGAWGAVSSTAQYKMTLDTVEGTLC